MENDKGQTIMDGGCKHKGVNSMIAFCVKTQCVKHLEEGAPENMECDQ